MKMYSRFKIIRKIKLLQSTIITSYDNTWSFVSLNISLF